MASLVEELTNRAAKIMTESHIKAPTAVSQACDELNGGELFREVLSRLGTHGAARQRVLRQTLNPDGRIFDSFHRTEQQIADARCPYADR